MTYATHQRRHIHTSASFCVIPNKLQCSGRTTHRELAFAWKQRNDFTIGRVLVVVNKRDRKRKVMWVGRVGVCVCVARGSVHQQTYELRAHRNRWFATRDDTPQQLMPSLNNVRRSWFIFRYTKCRYTKDRELFCCTNDTKNVCSYAVLSLRWNNRHWQYTLTNLTSHDWYWIFNLIRTVTENAALAHSLWGIQINP
jgi:hypothetical protein